MIKIWLSFLICMIFISLNINSTFALPSAPTLTVSSSGQAINLKWTSVPGATGYNLYYADFYNTVSIGSMDIGTAPQFSVTLPSDSAFYVALKAYDETGESDFSNVVSIKGKNSSTEFIDEQILMFSDLGVTEYAEIYGVHLFFLHPKNTDLDGDGDSDVILGFGSHAKEVSWQKYYHPVLLENLGNGTFKKIEIINQTVSQSYPREIVTADFNLDGRLDVMIAGHGYDGVDAWDGPDWGYLYPGNQDQNIILMSNSDGTYTDTSYMFSGLKEFTHSVTTGDVNNDGYPDIFIANFDTKDGSKPFRLFINDKGQDFNETTLPEFMSLTWGSYIGTHISACHLTDVDNDGIVELILGFHGHGGINKAAIVVDQDGLGNFENSYAELDVGLFGIDTLVMDISTGDVNGDGLIDIVLDETDGLIEDNGNYNGGNAHLNDGCFYVGRGLQVYIQQNDGSFVDETSTHIFGIGDSDDWITFTSLLDIDKDGDLDLLMRIDHEGLVEPNESFVLYNDGTGVFTKSDNYGYALNMTDQFYHSFDDVSGTYFGYITNFSVWEQTGVNDGSATLTIKQLDIPHP